MSKDKTEFVCSECGYKSVRWIGRCNSCHAYNTMEEKIIEKSTNKAHKHRDRTKTSKSDVKPINAAAKLFSKTKAEERVSTKIGELDRVLSGGLVTGSFALVGGEPGVGKSTLILQLCENLGSQNKKVLYSSGEESMSQIQMRAKRLEVKTDNLLILSETNLESIMDNVAYYKPEYLIVDSIQTLFLPEISSSPGSIPQVRESAQRLMKLAKADGITIIIIGHVTKDGQLAGPRLLEHMVDTVLYFEGETSTDYRMIRAVKNRFGTTNEIGMFEMQEKGLIEIKNPSEYMLKGRPIHVPGSVVTCAMEGTRAILTEAQALVAETAFGNPRRVAAGVDLNRVNMLLASIEKGAGIRLSDQDVYVNIAGGIKISEPASDAAVAAAVISSRLDREISPQTVIFGEVGLTGEIRAVSHIDKRLREAEKIGFTQCVMPEAGLTKTNTMHVKNMELIGVKNILGLLDSMKK